MGFARNISHNIFYSTVVFKELWSAVFSIEKQMCNMEVALSSPPLYLSESGSWSESTLNEHWKLLRALSVQFHFLLFFYFSFLSFESVQNKCLIIAVSVAFGFYEVQAVCSQAQVVDPYTHKISAGSTSFRKVNILQSIV